MDSSASSPDASQPDAPDASADAAALRLTATIAFNLIAVVAAVIVILRWRGFL